MKFKLNPQKWSPVTLAWVDQAQSALICEALLKDLAAAKQVLETSSNDWDQAGARWIGERISSIQSFEAQATELLRDPNLIEEIYQLACLDEELDRVESELAWKICESVRDRAKQALIIDAGS